MISQNLQGPLCPNWAGMDFTAVPTFSLSIRSLLEPLPERQRGYYVIGIQGSFTTEEATYLWRQADTEARCCNPFTKAMPVYTNESGDFTAITICCASVRWRKFTPGCLLTGGLRVNNGTGPIGI